MCLLVNIAADQPLILIAWDKLKPAFHVTEHINTDLVVRHQFHQPYIYYVGAHEGCGCGFQVGEYPQFEDDERTLKRASLDAFAFYLEHQLKNTKMIELFTCWEGDQTVAPEHIRYLTPKMLLSDEFFFLERELSQIEADPEEIHYDKLFGIG